MHAEASPNADRDSDRDPDRNADAPKMAAPRAPAGLTSRLRTLAARALPRSVLTYQGVGDARRVALTFDDGPHEMTEAYLDLLERFDARATFFVVGKECVGRTQLLRRMVERGHEVAGHGFTHRAFPKMGISPLRDELQETTDLLPPERATGRRLVRPPYGSTSVRSLAVCAASGYTTVMWSRDSDDCRTLAPEDVVARVVPADLRPGEIILLHEGQSWTLAALPRILEALTKAGWKAVTVGEILMPSSTPNWAPSKG
jgi:peptidoglycan/xylan/chitin deacetylase (PgdA/CDA1 family)